MSVSPRPVVDPSTHLDLDAIESAWSRLAPAPQDDGTLTHILSRLADGSRHEPQTVILHVNEGMPGDRWGTTPGRNPDAQLAAQSHRFSTLVANGQPLSLFGDNLTLDLDLSLENLPIGSLLEIGGAALVLTPKAHNGCLKYRGRFGADALRFISRKERRHERLRGVYLRVVMPGEISVGDTVRVSRAVG